MKYSSADSGAACAHLDGQGDRFSEIFARDTAPPPAPSSHTPLRFVRETLDATLPSCRCDILVGKLRARIFVRGVDVSKLDVVVAGIPENWWPELGNVCHGAKARYHPDYVSWRGKFTVHVLLDI
eukprot:1351766-Amorphochlora_amoeboformis.AAC.2